MKNLDDRGGFVKGFFAENNKPNKDGKSLQNNRMSLKKILKRLQSVSSPRKKSVSQSVNRTLKPKPMNTI